MIKYTELSITSVIRLMAPSSAVLSWRPSSAESLPLPTNQRRSSSPRWLCGWSPPMAAGRVRRSSHRHRWHRTAALAPRLPSGERAHWWRSDAMRLRRRQWVDSPLVSVRRASTALRPAEEHHQREPDGAGALVERARRAEQPTIRWSKRRQGAARAPPASLGVADGADVGGVDGAGGVDDARDARGARRELLPVESGADRRRRREAASRRLDAAAPRVGRHGRA